MMLNKSHKFQHHPPTRSPRVTRHPGTEKPPSSTGKFLRFPNKRRELISSLLLKMIDRVESTEASTISTPWRSNQPMQRDRVLVLLSKLAGNIASVQFQEGAADVTAVHDIGTRCPISSQCSLTGAAVNVRSAPKGERVACCDFLRFARLDSRHP